MRLLITITKGENAKQKAQFIKVGNDTAIITAPTLQDALRVIPSEEELDNAPEVAPIGAATKGDDSPHYRISPVSEEALDKTITEYEATTAGASLARKLEQARILRKKTGHSVSAAEFCYMIARAYKDAYNTIYDYYDLAFKRGYDAAKREQRKKKGKAAC